MSKDFDSALSAHSTGSAGVAAEPVAMEDVAFYAWRCREGEGSRQRWASAIQHKERYPGGYDDRSVTAAYEAATDILALFKHPPVAAEPMAPKVIEGKTWTGAPCPVLAAAPTPPAGGGETIQATQITLGEGLVDIGPIEHEGRVGVLFRPRAAHIPFGQAGELQECAYWPGPNDVVLWVSGEGPQVAIDALAALAPKAPASPAGDLISLSAGATQGTLSVSGSRRRYDEPSCVIVDASSCRALFALATGERGKDTLQSLADAKFLVGLWNAYRSGRLVEAAPAAPTNGPSEEEIAKKTADLRKQARIYWSVGSYTSADQANAVADAYEEALTLLTPADWGETQAVADPLVAYLERQWAWSKETFGPALRTKGIVQHITKELREIEADPHDLAEWVDVIILAMDGFWRHGGQPADLLSAMQAKQDRNFARTWPDWRTMGEDQAIEHDRSGERDAYTAEDALRSLASWLGVGGYNASTVDPDLFEKKIRDGVDMMLAPWMIDAQRYRKLRGIGAAPGGTLHLDEGLVFVATNLDAWLDAALAGTPVAPAHAVEFDPAAWPKPPSPDQNRGEPDQGGANTEAGR